MIARLIDNSTARDKDKIMEQLTEIKKEFYRLAENPPQADMPSIFTLKVWEYRDDRAYYRYAPKSHTWSFSVYNYSSAYSSFEKAFDAMRRFIAKDGAFNEIHHFEITRKPIDVALGKDIHIGWWLYDARGNELTKSICSCFTHDESLGLPMANFGRKPEELRFKVGEIVEVLAEDRCWLGVVNDLPLFVDDAYRRYERSILKYECLPEEGYDSDYFYDEMSDFQFVITPWNGSDEQYSQATLFKPTFPISEKAKTQLTGMFERWKANVDRAVSSEISWKQLAEIVKPK